MTEAICGQCKIPLEGPPDAKPDDTFRCPKCGNSDTLENVMRIVGEFIEERLAESLNASFSQATRGSKYVTFKPNLTPKRHHRFEAALST